MAADVDALNYPYIRVRSADWLKRTLLIFPHVVRMTPFEGAPADDPEIAAFAQFAGRRAPLLRSADLHNTHVYEAQRELVAELRTRLGADERNFRRRFGRESAGQRDVGSIKTPTVWERRLAAGATFQIHSYKLFEELTDFLRQERLAWRPARGIADGPQYLEMHPALGEAVMATLAMACAENEGLQVVTEFPELHGKLLGTPREKILSACLDGARPSGRTSGEQIAEFLVYRRCDVDRLSVEGIAALKRERDALSEFRGRLEELAKTLPPTIHSDERLQERLDDLLSDMFREWERDQANLSASARKFFGEGVLSEPGKLVQRLVEAAVKPETGHDVIKGAMVGSIAGVPSGVLAGAGAGFVVALVFRTVESWGKARRSAKKSPLRYLTRLQEQGVSFSVGR